MPTGRIGLVLGAGGLAGAAYHAGTLLALQHDLGWNAHRADFIVGSSAGSIVGALLRAGLSIDDVAAWAAGVPALPNGVTTRRVLDDAEAARRGLVPSLPFPRIVSRLAAHQVLTRSQYGSRSGSRSGEVQGVPRHTAAMALLPRGWIDASSTIRRIGGLFDSWPDQSLWVPAVRTSDARRIVFGRDSVDTDVGTAVAASCAIPGLFRPVRIGGHHFIDGATHSPTNADLLVGSGVRTAIILSPMSAATRVGIGRIDRTARALFSNQLSVERARLEADGIDVHIFEPTEQIIHAMGRNPLARGRGASIIRESFLAAGELAADSPGLRLSLS